MASLDQLWEWMGKDESEHLEFKEAKNNYDRDKLLKYCAALANERGGILVMGVSDKPPRRVVGTAFAAIDQIKSAVLDKLRLRLEVEEIIHPDGRVLAFHIASRPTGRPVGLDGVYWMRSGEELVAMTADVLQAIFAEDVPDFSAEICAKASLADLSVEAIENFRTRWLRKWGDLAASSREQARRIATLSPAQLLEDAELTVDGGVTFAALVLCGTRPALGRYLARSEIVFEYRPSDASGPAADRTEYREGFFACYDSLWDKINLRNDKQPFQERLFVLDIPTFNERTIREALLNAVSHRDYRDPGTTFVRQYPRRIEIVSPGGFPPGITVSNILDRQVPRNRRIAEAFARCGLVERSGQGVNLMFEQCIKESKPRPDFAGTDSHQVSLTLRGDVQDVRFLQFLEKLGPERVSPLSTQDLLLLDTIHAERRVPAELRGRLPQLVEAGVIEPAGHGRYTLSRRFYDFLGQKGTYTRKRGLDKATQKALLLKHIMENNAVGSRLLELGQVLPGASPRQVQYLLALLKKEGQISPVGVGEKGRWFLAPPAHMEQSAK